jgi:hypothetical protein
MRLLRWTIGLWPGFALAWNGGRWEGLLVAAVFSTALNGGLALTVIDQVPLGGWRLLTAGLAWLLVLGLLAFGIWRPPRAGLREAGGKPDEAEAIDVAFGEAQHEYLKGHWLEAELIIGRLLAKHPRDVEARLLRASIERRTRRWAEARQTLAALAADERAAKWWPEIAAEMEQIAELQSERELSHAADRRGAA